MLDSFEYHGHTADLCYTLIPEGYTTYEAVRAKEMVQSQESDYSLQAMLAKTVLRI